MHLIPRSTTSQNSWEEEDRSVGGEVEVAEVPTMRPGGAQQHQHPLHHRGSDDSGAKSPGSALHETHFDGEEDEDVIMHHPQQPGGAGAVGTYQPLDPYQQQVQQLLQDHRERERLQQQNREQQIQVIFYNNILEMKVFQIILLSRTPCTPSPTTVFLPP